MRDIDFELTKTFKYAHNNKELECSHIQLREPTGKETHLCCALGSLVKSSMLNAAKLLDELGGDIMQDAIAEAEVKAEAKKNSDDSEDVLDNDDDEVKDGDALMQTLESTGADLENIVLRTKELFKATAFMGGEKRITAARLDEMSHKDLRRMVGVYLANFINS